MVKRWLNNFGKREQMKKKKETKYSNAGKGDKNRVSDSKRYADNWDKIFKKEK